MPRRPSNLRSWRLWNNMQDSNVKPVPPGSGSTDITSQPLPPVATLTTAQLAPAPTPLAWRFAIVAALAAVIGTAYLIGDGAGQRFRSACGVIAFFGIVALFSSN